MLSKRVLERWYFDYYEAEREFIEARQIFEMKRRDVCLFVFNAYADWCRKKYGEVLRPEESIVSGEVEKPVALFFADFEISSCYRDIVARLLNQAFDERFGGVSKNE